MAEVLLRFAEWAWNHLPASWLDIRAVQACGHFLHGLVCRRRHRRQYFGTSFLRNRPQLELIRRVSDRHARGSTLRIAVLGCSNGAEVYSILAVIRSARRDLHVVMHAVDISRDVLDLAREGAYSLTGPALVDAPLFHGMTEADIRDIFDKEDDRVTVKPWIREGIVWHLADARDAGLLAALGHQDIVVANNFLCHMNASDAEQCLRQVARLVGPGGHLVVSGIDLDLRARVARDLRWTPVTHLLEEVHEGDPAVRNDWPWRYWGLEPLDKSQRNWPVRYATVFRVGESTSGEVRRLIGVACL